METTTAAGRDGTPNYVVVGLAVGIPCGIVILVLLILIVVMVWFTTCKAENEEQIEAMYMRKRFQGLSLEEQRRMQKTNKGIFKARRRSSATGSKPNIHSSPNTRRARVRKANPFQLQNWQLKLSGIDMTVDSEETEETDIDSPRTPVGAINPLLLQDTNEEIVPSYEPVRQPQEVNVEMHPQQNSLPHIQPDGDSSDSFNPYD